MEGIKNNNHPILSRQRRWQIKMVQEGKCAQCGGEKEEERKDKVHCAKCAKHNLEKIKASPSYIAKSYLPAQRERRERLKMQGLCGHCGKRRVVFGKKSCRICLDFFREYQKRYSKRK